MRTSTAFFAGVGTVFVAIAAGLGGGLTIGNVMSPQTPQYGKLDRHGTSSDSRATKDPMVPVPYLAATKESANAAVVVSPAERKPAQPQQNDGANSSAPAAPAAPPANVTASNEQTAKSSDATLPDASKADVSKADVTKPEVTKADISKPSEVVAAKPSAATVQPAVAREQVSAPDDAYAKARDADLKRDADQKRAERRKAERRAQQWADRRRAQQGRDQDDLRAVEESVREDSEARAYPVYREQPARAEFPIRLFGND
jgi:hypothetical protein